VGISVITFALMRLIPGDPARIMAGERATEEQVQRVREIWGLNKPIHEQYVIYMGKVLRGDLGNSLKRNEAVVTEIRWALPTTIELAFSAMFIACLIGIPAGILAAYRRNTWIDLLSWLEAWWESPCQSSGWDCCSSSCSPAAWPAASLRRLSVGVDLQLITGLYMLDALFAGQHSRSVGRHQAHDSSGVRRGDDPHGRHRAHELAPACWRSCSRIISGRLAPKGYPSSSC